MNNEPRCFLSGPLPPAKTAGWLVLFHCESRFIRTELTGDYGHGIILSKAAPGKPTHSDGGISTHIQPFLFIEDCMVPLDAELYIIDFNMEPIEHYPHEIIRHKKNRTTDMLSGGI